MAEKCGAGKATVLTFCQQFVFLLPLIAVAPLVLLGLGGVGPLTAVFWACSLPILLRRPLRLPFWRKP
ncbi:hypothetical protein [Adlercreutzia mucosicola]|uniref:hypothetical protein n=1 Tax=Adlercreutzia mucosicola TaxID=580026 RepID=UPI002B253F4B|nr:hypothetical protein [Adlercreutzia mucosicola]MEB1814287.1 hypothetical protein [Adlercreutzia mucosicola]